MGRESRGHVWGLLLRDPGYLPWAFLPPTGVRALLRRTGNRKLVRRHRDGVDRLRDHAPRGPALAHHARGVHGVEDGSRELRYWRAIRPLFPSLGLPADHGHSPHAPPPPPPHAT